MDVVDQLMYSTMRITSLNGAGASISVGSGFLFWLPTESNIKTPLLITNRHVLADATDVVLHFNVADSHGEPVLGSYSSHTLRDIQTFTIPHPDSHVDLAAIQIGYMLNYLKTKGINPYFKVLDGGILPRADAWQKFLAVEDVLMVGYPSGIWDATNNLPVFRKGITATHPGISYNGKEEFLIDCAVFHGSSGSPVFIFNQGAYPTKGGTIQLGSRLVLIGILYAIYQYQASGDIAIVEAPSTYRPVVQSLIPNNLGVVIRSSKLLDFESLIDKNGTTRSITTE